MAERIVDREGWPIAPTAEVEMFAPTGTKMTAHAEVVKVEPHPKYPMGVVHYRNMRTLHEGTIPADRVRVIKKNEDGDRWKRYRHGRKVVEMESAAVTKLARKTRRVATPRKKSE